MLTTTTAPAPVATQPTRSPLEVLVARHGLSCEHGIAVQHEQAIAAMLTLGVNTDCGSCIALELAL